MVSEPAAAESPALRLLALLNGRVRAHEQRSRARALSPPGHSPLGPSPPGPSPPGHSSQAELQALLQLSRESGDGLRVALKSIEEERSLPLTPAPLADANQRSSSTHRSSPAAASSSAAVGTAPAVGAAPDRALCALRAELVEEEEE